MTAADVLVFELADAFARWGKRLRLDVVRVGQTLIFTAQIKPETMSGRGTEAFAYTYAVAELRLNPDHVYHHAAVALRRLSEFVVRPVLLEDRDWAKEADAIDAIADSKVPDAMTAQRAMLTKRFGKSLGRTLAHKYAEECEESRAPAPTMPQPPRRERRRSPWVDPESVAPTEQTWHARIETGVGGDEFCDGVCLVVNGRPSPVNRVVETDGGVYPPSLAQADLIAAAPELYRFARDIETALSKMACTQEIDRIRVRGHAAMAKATGMTPRLRRRRA